VSASSRARTSGQHPLESLSVESLYCNERQVRHNTEDHHQPAHHRAAPQEKRRSGTQVGPVHQFGSSGLGCEAVEVLFGAAGQVSFGEPVGKEVARFWQAVLPVSDAQVSLVERAVGLEGPFAGDDVVLVQTAQRQARG
jgi:hypothetical protein